MRVECGGELLSFDYAAVVGVDIMEGALQLFFIAVGVQLGSDVGEDGGFEFVFELN